MTPARQLDRTRRRFGRGEDFFFTSGQVAIDPATQQVIAGDVAAQTDRVLKNLAAILQASGSGFEKVVRCTVFLKNMGDFAAMNECLRAVLYVGATGTVYC